MMMKVQNIARFSECSSYTSIRGATIRLIAIITDFFFCLALGVHKYRVTENGHYRSDLFTQSSVCRVFLIVAHGSGFALLYGAESCHGKCHNTCICATAVRSCHSKSWNLCMKLLWTPGSGMWHMEGVCSCSLGRTHRDEICGLSVLFLNATVLLYPVPPGHSGCPLQHHDGTLSK